MGVVSQSAVSLRPPADRTAHCLEALIWGPHVMSGQPLYNALFIIREQRLVATSIRPVPFLMFRIFVYRILDPRATGLLPFREMVSRERKHGKSETLDVVASAPRPPPDDDARTTHPGLVKVVISRRF
jgi:hypothetical protein